MLPDEDDSLIQLSDAECTASFFFFKEADVCY